MKKLGSFLALSLAAFAAGAANRTIDISDSEKVQIFDEPGAHNWIAPNNLAGAAQLLVVGGGGAGGGISGGGGGGGEVVYNSAVTLTAGKSYTITVADGGIATTGNGGNGGTSSIAADGFATISAIGGGGGGGGWSPTKGLNGANGGGAGGNGNQASCDGGQPTVTGGHKGADSAATNFAYGGGGGMTEDGHMYNADPGPGYGGAGVTYAITGEDVMYGYGGGACRNSKDAALSGAGNEWGRGCSNVAADNTPGEEGTGGGGGGGMRATGGSFGSDGGCGTVIIRYTIDTAIDDFDANVKRSIKVPTTVTFTANLGTALSTMTWDFGDGTEAVATTELSVSHQYDAPGLYTVTMTHGSQMIVKKDYIEIVSGTLYVDAGSTNPTPPYDTRATAATKVTDALQLAENGFEIHVAPGTYSLDEAIGVDCKIGDQDFNEKDTKGLFLTNAVSVIGEGTSPTDVVIKATRRRNYYKDMVAVVDNANAKICNVTLADGKASNSGWGGCVWITSNGGTVSNCVIRNGLANVPVRAKAGGAYLNNGLITHSVFEDCQFDDFYKDAFGVVDLGNSRIASGAFVADKGRLENCLFRNCTSDYGDVIAVNGQNASVVNCTVADGRIGFWTSKSQRNTMPIVIGGTEYKAYSVLVEAVTNDGFAVGCIAGSVKNCAVYNVKRVAYLDREETYDAAFGPDASKFTACVKVEKVDFKDCDNGNFVPRVSGALYDKGTEIEGFADISDLAGKPRVFGKAIDVGCYESQQHRRGVLIIFR